MKFVLSEKVLVTVLVTLLCTTTANVIGLLVIVMRYLFPGPTKSQVRGTTKSGTSTKLNS